MRSVQQGGWRWPHPRRPKRARLAAALGLAAAIVLAAGCGSLAQGGGNSSLWSAPAMDDAPRTGSTDDPAGAAAKVAADEATDAATGDWPSQQLDADAQMASATAETAAAGQEVAAACGALCWFAAKHCRGPSIVYASVPSCQTDCLRLPALGEPGATAGNSVACRLTYALLAKDGQNMLFCQNASAAGGAQCR